MRGLDKGVALGYRLRREIQKIARTISTGRLKRNFHSDVSINIYSIIRVI